MTELFSLGCLMKRIISASLISALLEPWSCGKSKAKNLHSIFVFDLIIKEITLLFKRPAVARELCLGFFSQLRRLIIFSTVLPERCWRAATGQRRCCRSLLNTHIKSRIVPPSHPVFSVSCKARCRNMCFQSRLPAALFMQVSVQLVCVERSCQQNLSNYSLTAFLLVLFFSN